MITKLIVEDGVNTENRVIILNYWQFENNKFVNSPESIADRYNMSLENLNQLIGSQSAFRYQSAICIECAIPFMSETKVQMDVARVYDKSFWMCDECYAVQEREFKERKALRDKL